MKKIKLLILGAGGHCKVLIDCLKKSTNNQIIGILDNNPKFKGQFISGIEVLGSDSEILNEFSSSNVQLVNAVGSVGIPEQRKNVFIRLKHAGYQFFSVIHPTAYVADNVKLGEGVQVMAGSVIQPGCEIGDNVIINTHASVDHDSIIHNHVHLAPGVVCCGNVSIGADTHIGCGAVILQNTTIEAHCLIAAGAVVVQDVRLGSKIAGVPAKQME